jgi:hypothetical protein
MRWSVALGLTGLVLTTTSSGKPTVTGSAAAAGATSASEELAAADECNLPAASSQHGPANQAH